MKQILAITVVIIIVFAGCYKPAGKTAKEKEEEIGKLNARNTLQFVGVWERVPGQDEPNFESYEIIMDRNGGAVFKQKRIWANYHWKMETLEDGNTEYVAFYFRNEKQTSIAKMENDRLVISPWTSTGRNQKVYFTRKEKGAEEPAAGDGRKASAAELPYAGLWVMEEGQRIPDDYAAVQIELTRDMVSYWTTGRFTFLGTWKEKKNGEGGQDGIMVNDSIFCTLDGKKLLVYPDTKTIMRYRKSR